MTWSVDFAHDFDSEFDEYPDDVRTDILQLLKGLASEGPEMGRPHVDTLKGSAHSNMKELRCRGTCKTWRVAFAFTPDQRALLLAGGNKAGKKERRFYQGLIRKADARFDEYLAHATRKESSQDDST